MFAMNVSKVVDVSLSNLCTWGLNPAVWSFAYTSWKKQQFTSGSMFNGVRKDSIVIIHIYDYNIFVAMTGLTADAPCLVRIYFALNVRQGDKDMMGLYVSWVLEGLIILNCCGPGPLPLLDEMALDSGRFSSFDKL